MLSVIIPTHNEEKRISATMKQLLAYLNQRNFSYEIIIADDGRDETAGICRRFALRNKRIRVFHFNKRLGKWGAIKAVAGKAHGNVLLYDADASTLPKEIGTAVNALMESDLAIGSIWLSKSRVKNFSLRRRASSKAFNVLANLLFLLGISDTQRGFKACKNNAFKKICAMMKETGFVGDVEFLWLAKKLGYSIREIPIEWTYESGGPFASASHVKRALEMLVDLVKLRLSTLSQ